MLLSRAHLLSGDVERGKVHVLKNTEFMNAAKSTNGETIEMFIYRAQNGNLHSDNSITKCS